MEGKNGNFTDLIWCENYKRRFYSKIKNTKKRKVESELSIFKNKCRRKRKK